MKRSLPLLITRLGRAYASHRYAILFYSLLATVAAVPLLEALRLDAELLELFLAMNLIAGVLGLEAGGRRRVLLIVAGTTLLIHFAFGQAAVYLRPAALAFWTVIALLSAAFALRYALRSTRVDAEHLYAALSAYLLGGVFFGALYHGVAHVWPGSFNASVATGALPLPDAIYFSFVTLATLGYGDLVPVTGIARGLAVIEAVSGQLFLAVLVARLVSSHVGTRGGRER